MLKSKDGLWVRSRTLKCESSARPEAPEAAFGWLCVCFFSASGSQTHLLYSSKPFLTGSWSQIIWFFLLRLQRLQRRVAGQAVSNEVLQTAWPCLWVSWFAKVCACWYEGQNHSRGLRWDHNLNHWPRVTSSSMQLIWGLSLSQASPVTFLSVTNWKILLT